MSNYNQVLECSLNLNLLHRSATISHFEVVNNAYELEQVYFYGRRITEERNNRNELAGSIANYIA